MNENMTMGQYEGLITQETLNIDNRESLVNKHNLYLTKSESE